MLYIVDQQIARHFVHHPPLYATQIINPFLTSRISANHGKGLEFSKSGKPYNRYCSSNVESLLLKYLKKNEIMFYNIKKSSFFAFFVQITLLFDS